MSQGIRQIVRADFPPLLQEIPDCPHTLYIRGVLPNPTYIALGVIGSRRMSAYGKRVCEQLVEGLRGYPIAIISGLALGLDSVAHEAALRAGLPTVAVLPSGLGDTAIYPASHRPLAQKILQAGGALISEYKPEDKPREYSFAARNRIVAGLSKAVLVIEAAERSGTSITTRLALDYNREVLAVPHPLGSETGSGTNTLIRGGATLIRSTEDILEALGFATQTDEHKHLVHDLSPDEQTLYTLLSEPQERGMLAELSHMPAQRVNVALSMLNIKGIIKEELGKIVRL